MLCLISWVKFLFSIDYSFFLQHLHFIHTYRLPLVVCSTMVILSLLISLPAYLTRSKELRTMLIALYSTSIRLIMSHQFCAIFTGCQFGLTSYFRFAILRYHVHGLALIYLSLTSPASQFDLPMPVFSLPHGSDWRGSAITHSLSLAPVFEMHCLSLFILGRC